MQTTQTTIVGFEQDDAGHWVARLACGHSQHVRHRPPWELRPWVLTDEGRRAKVGATLQCPRCDDPPPASGDGAVRRPG